MVYNFKKNPREVSSNFVLLYRQKKWNIAYYFSMVYSRLEGVIYLLVWYIMENIRCHIINV